MLYEAMINFSIVLLLTVYIFVYLPALSLSNDKVQVFLTEIA